MPTQTGLPVESVLPRLAEALNVHSAAVLIAAPFGVAQGAASHTFRLAAGRS